MNNSIGDCVLACIGHTIEAWDSFWRGVTNSST